MRQDKINEWTEGEKKQTVPPSTDGKTPKIDPATHMEAQHGIATPPIASTCDDVRLATVETHESTSATTTNRSAQLLCCLLWSFPDCTYRIRPTKLLCVSLGTATIEDETLVVDLDFDHPTKNPLSVCGIICVGHIISMHIRPGLGSIPGTRSARF
jgi:hypothetical protein